MRLPNGFGSVAKLSGNRRNPYVVRKTTGFDERGYPIYAVLGYVAERKDGIALLAENNKDPWDIDRAKITFKELFELWEEKKLPKFGKSNQSSMRSAYKHCVAMHGLQYKNVRAHHMQDAIDGCGCGYSTQGAIKALLRHLDNFALELDVTHKQYSALISSDPIPETSKRPFTDAEINALWARKDAPWVDSVLMYLYTGFRLSELLAVECGQVNMQQQTITGGTKTKAGKNRVVPIHPRIAPLVAARMGGGRLLEHNGGICHPSTYYEYWGAVMGQSGMEHTVHETRHTFRSRLDSAGANKVCIDLLMGHKSTDVGERVYTHKTIEELRAAISLLP